MYLDKKYFYKALEPFENKHTPIYIDIPLSKDDLRYRIIFSWSHRKPNGDFNPLMSCQLIDTHQQGIKKYVARDLIFDCIKEGVTTQYKLYKYLEAWIKNAFLEKQNKKSVNGGYKND